LLIHKTVNISIVSTKFESSVRHIEASQQKVYDMLSNLQNIERVRNRIPEDKVQGLEFDRDSVSLEAPMVGRVAMQIVDREEPKTVKFEATQSPVPLNFWIQLLPEGEEACKMKLTIKAELNMFIRAMVQKPLQEGIEKMADVLQAIDYTAISQTEIPPTDGTETLEQEL
jgi:carbon monoxide dehydrogenase subunit G